MNPCPLCNDTGWKFVGPEHDRRTTRCDCRLATRADRLLQLARIPKRYQHCELPNFEVMPGPHEAAMHRAKLAAGRFVEEYPLERNGLLLTGPIGVGKTHLAVAIVHELVRSKGIACLFCDYRELLKEIQNSYNETVNATEMDVLRPVMTTELVVLDDLGAVKPTQWVWDTVSLVLNTRYNEKLTTIITTNLPDAPPLGAGDGDSRSRSSAKHAASEPTLGDHITERTRSRLHEMCKKIEMSGEDFRQKIMSASFR